MNDLSPHARGLLDEAQGAYEPGPEDAARVRAAIAIAVPGVAGAAATVAKAQAAGVLKISAFVASVVVGSLGVVEGTTILRRAPVVAPPVYVAVVKHAAPLARPAPVEAPAPVIEADVMEIAAPPATHPVSAPLAHATPKPAAAPVVTVAPEGSTPPDGSAHPERSRDV